MIKYLDDKNKRRSYMDKYSTFNGNDRTVINFSVNDKTLIILTKIKKSDHSNQNLNNPYIP